MKRRNRPVYAATLYHDSPGEASDDTRDLGYHPSLALAVAAINEARDPARGWESAGWFTGGVEYGFLWEPIPGKAPEYFERDEREPSWFVGTDGRAVR